MKIKCKSSHPCPELIKLSIIDFNQFLVTVNPLTGTINLDLHGAFTLITPRSDELTKGFG